MTPLAAYGADLGRPDAAGESFHGDRGDRRELHVVVQRNGVLDRVLDGLAQIPAAVRICWNGHQASVHRRSDEVVTRGEEFEVLFFYLFCLRRWNWAGQGGVKQQRREGEIKRDKL